MKIRLFLSVLFLMMSTAAACGQSTDTTTEGASESGAVTQANDDVDLASEFTLTSLSGEEVTLSSLRGRYVLVNFWATWCTPCRKEMPYLQKLSDEYPDQLTVLGVNLREEPKRIYPFIEEFELTFPILLDPSNEMVAENNVRGLPVSYVVGPDGTVVYRKIGEITPEEFDPWLDEHLESS